MDEMQREKRVLQIKIWSFLIAMALCSVIHGFAPGWLTLLTMVFVLMWATYGYKRLFSGWPSVLTLRGSGRAFILAVCWPLVFT